MAGNGPITVKWINPIEDLQKSIVQYGDRVIVAILSIAQYIATKAQNEMRHNAPWTDRTGNARNALFSMAQMASTDLVIIYLSHGSAIEYGIMLETGYGMKYAIIVPTMQRLLPQLENMLKQLFK